MITSSLNSTLTCLIYSLKSATFFQNLTPNCHYVPIRRKFIFRIFTTLVNALRKDVLIDELFEIGHQRPSGGSEIILSATPFPSFEKSAAEMLQNLTQSSSVKTTFKINVILTFFSNRVRITWTCHFGTRITPI